MNSFDHFSNTGKIRKCIAFKNLNGWPLTKTAFPPQPSSKSDLMVSLSLKTRDANFLVVFARSLEK